MSTSPNEAHTSPRQEVSSRINLTKESGYRTPEVDTSKFQNLVRNGLSRALFPGGDRSLSGVALRAFLLGGGTVLGFLTSVLLAAFDSHLWRPLFFVGTLCVFHFLEFWITAEFNTPSAFISSFLLSNGSRYRQAHTFAFLEALITSYFFPDWQSQINPPAVIALGIIMIIGGQFVRSLAMAQAGTNFNHIVQSERNEGHELVTNGLYAYFRHPSYFGFFWWGLGTQVALGNSISLAAYAVALWWFFKTRIQHEEKHLVEFFGKDYEEYRQRTRVWIPFI